MSPAPYLETQDEVCQVAHDKSQKWGYTELLGAATEESGLIPPPCMRKKIVLLAGIFSLVIPFLLGLLPAPSQAGVFWEEDFENHLYPNWNGGSGCITSGSPDGAACGNPQISTTYTCPNGVSNGGPGMPCNFTPNTAAVGLNDNKWHCVETHQDSATGTIDLYIDQMQTLHYTGLPMDNSGYTFLRTYAQYGQGDRYQDGLAVGNTRIGCGTAAGGNMPPAKPKNLRSF